MLIGARVELNNRCTDDRLILMEFTKNIWSKELKTLIERRKLIISLVQMRDLAFLLKRIQLVVVAFCSTCNMTMAMTLCVLLFLYVCVVLLVS